MDRFTKMSDNSNRYMVENTMVEQTGSGYSGDAIDRLAKFENLYEDLVEKQQKTVEAMEILRQEDKTSTVKFKQLLIDKLTNNNLLIRFKYFGLE